MRSLNRWSALLTRVFHVTFDEVYPIVCPVVCHSSPEGYLPPDTEHEQQDSEGMYTCEMQDGLIKSL